MWKEFAYLGLLNELCWYASPYSLGLRMLSSFTRYGEPVVYSLKIRSLLWSKKLLSFWKLKSMRFICYEFSSECFLEVFRRDGLASLWSNSFLGDSAPKMGSGISSIDETYEFILSSTSDLLFSNSFYYCISRSVDSFSF